MNDLFKNFKIQPTKLRGENMEIKQKALDGINEITYDTKTEISTVTLAHTYRPCIDLYDGDEHIAHYETDKEFIEDFKRIKQENQQLKEKYNKALSILANEPPCEIDGFMDKNTDYCSINCGVDDEIFKECWNKYIEQELENGDSNE